MLKAASLNSSRSNYNAFMLTCLIWYSAAIYLLVPQYYQGLLDIVIFNYRIIYYTPIILLFLIVFFNLATASLGFQKVNTNIFIFLVIFSLLGLSSAILSQDPVFGTFYMAVFFISFLIITLVINNLTETEIARMLCYAGLGIILLGFASFCLEGKPGARFGMNIFINPNSVGIILATGTVALLGFQGRLKYFILPLGLFVTAMTGSRNALLALTATVALFIFVEYFYIKLSRKLLILVFSGIFLANFLLTLILTYSDPKIHITDIFPDEKIILYQLDMRLDKQIITKSLAERINIFKNYPDSLNISLLGEGPKMSAKLLYERGRTGGHNGYLELLYDFGVLGCLVYLCWVLYALISYIKNTNNLSPLPVQCYILIITGTCGLFDANMLSFLSPSGLMFCISLCGLPGGKNTDNNNSSKSRSLTRLG